MKAVVVCAAVLALGLWLGPATAQVRLSGSFAADQACPATQAIKSAKNPGNIQTQAGQSYDLLGANKDQPTHYLIRVPDAQPAERWVAISCGHVASGDNAAPVAVPAPKQASNGGEAGAEFLLAISWQPAFCETKAGKPECRAMRADSFDAQHFTLHGLWPQPNGHFYCNVADRDQRNDRPGGWDDLPAVTLDPATRAELDQVMPGTASDLERHEWIKHGTCSGKDQQAYFADALRLMRAVNGSSVQQLFAQSIGRQLTSDKVRAAFDQAFGKGAGSRVRLACVQGPSRGQQMITEVSVSLVGPITDDKSLGDLILAARPVSNPGCRSGIVDRAG